MGESVLEYVEQQQQAAEQVEQSLSSSQSQDAGLFNGRTLHSQVHEVITTGGVDVATAAYVNNHSPNLSPVRKEFSQASGGLDDLLGGETNGSGNDSRGVVENVVVDDVMVRSFIEDPSNPQSNPFNADENQIANQAPQHQKQLLNDSNDLNRTHELPDDDEEVEDGLVISNGNGNHHEGENGFGKAGSFDAAADKLINGIESLKLSNAAANGNGTGIHYENGNGNDNGSDNGNGEPKDWHLLQLPKPVNPNESGSQQPSEKKSSTTATKTTTAKTPASPSASPAASSSLSAAVHAG